MPPFPKQRDEQGMISNHKEQGANQKRCFATAQKQRLWVHSKIVRPIKPFTFSPISEPANFLHWQKPATPLPTVLHLLISLTQG